MVGKAMCLRFHVLLALCSIPHASQRAVCIATTSDSRISTVRAVQSLWLPCAQSTGDH